MFVSAFDVFKISVGPSSSHTMGPMLAAKAFVELVNAQDAFADDTIKLQCTLHGSLAFTGVGHGTHRAVLAGLLGVVPETFDAGDVEARLENLATSKRLTFSNSSSVAADPETLIISDRANRLPLHPNGMVFVLIDAGGAVLISETYYSVGGGFVMTAAELENPQPSLEKKNVAYPFPNADAMLEMGAASGLSIAEMKLANEAALLAPDEVAKGLAYVWSVMDASIERGLAAEGQLPGGLNVPRRAHKLAVGLRTKDGSNSAPLHQATDWLAAYAMAVNEENAAGGQVVTAPTNGAAGVIPAVIRYYLDHVPGAERDRVPEMLLTAAAIGGLIKFNASISGAEVGCQGEVGSASAMAAAALCAVLGGTNTQIENAAEIALEHHLGMTCDPVRGLVQVPCIERNGMGAVKAVAAASLSLAGDGQHIVSLDACIETMRQTGQDMDERYKETSLGGLSVSVPEC